MIVVAALLPTDLKRVSMFVSRPAFEHSDAGAPRQSIRALLRFYTLAFAARTALLFG